jgi:hypothetical protein
MSQVEPKGGAGYEPGATRLLKRAPGRVLRTLHRELSTWQETRDLRPTLARVRPYSMVPEFGLVQLARTVRDILQAQVPGDFVECGTWKGGASFLAADVLRRAGVTDRRVWLCDSFEGHRPPEAIDGPAALDYARDTDNPEYRDNCKADLEETQRAAVELGLSGYTQFVKGWFDETLPVTRDKIGPISILRIDCDWYASVRCVLDNLYDQVSPGGIVIFDDYFSYDGCALAIYDFFAERRLTHRIETDSGVAFFRKV